MRSSMLRPLTVRPSQLTRTWTFNPLSARTKTAAARACKPCVLISVSSARAPRESGIQGRAHSAREVTVTDVHGIAPAAQPPAQLFSDRHGAVPAPGAAYRQGQITLAFTYIQGQGRFEQRADLVEKPLGLGPLQDKGCDFRLDAALSPEFFEKKRIRQEPHVEHQVGIGRHSI